jgi:hypothetical protein
MAQILSRRKISICARRLGLLLSTPAREKEAKQIVYLSGYCPDSREVGAKVLRPIGGAPRHGWRGIRPAAQVSANGCKRHHQE